MQPHRAIHARQRQSHDTQQQVAASFGNSTKQTRQTRRHGKGAKEYSSLWVQAVQCQNAVLLDFFPNSAKQTQQTHRHGKGAKEYRSLWVQAVQRQNAVLLDFFPNSMSLASLILVAR
jgi:hypothetical protein